MTTDQVLSLVRLAVQESNRHPVIAFTDQNGLPQPVTLPFAHLNRKLSLILLVPTEGELLKTIQSQSWVEVQFHTQSHHCFVRFGGRLLSSQLETASERLIEGYPFLKDWLTGPQASEITLVQLHTQLLGLELFQSDSFWFKSSHYRVQNGEPLPIAEAEIADLQSQGSGQLDLVRRIITHNRGKMIQSILAQDYEGFSAEIASNFEPPESQTLEDWINSQWKLYSDIDHDRMSFTWGLNGFELKRDGSVECRFVLEITDGGKKRIFQKQEIWLLENNAWKLFSIS